MTKSTLVAAWVRGTNPLIEGCNYKLELRGSELLWVILAARGAASGRFSYYREAQALPGSLLFALTLYEDGYQGCLEELQELIERLRRENDFQRIIFVGFSAGAFAALWLGVRTANAHRILAFAPHLRLDDPMTAAEETIEPPVPDAIRFNSRYVDVLPELAQAEVGCDLFLPLHSLGDGITIEKARGLNNRLVNVHYIRYGHVVTAELARLGLLRGIFEAADKGGPVRLPPSLVGTEPEIDQAIRVYYLERALRAGGNPDLPDDPDDACVNPAWWGVKSRIRARSGDLHGAIADVMRAILLSTEGARAGNLMGAGHLFRRLELDDFAEFYYRQASEAAPQNWRSFLALAHLHARQKRWDAFTAALEAASTAGAPPDEIMAARRAGPPR